MYFFVYFTGIRRINIRLKMFNQSPNPINFKYILAETQEKRRILQKSSGSTVKIACIIDELIMKNGTIHASNPLFSIIEYVLRILFTLVEWEMRMGSLYRNRIMALICSI